MTTKGDEQAWLTARRGTWPRQAPHCGVVQLKPSTSAPKLFFVQVVGVGVGIVEVVALLVVLLLLLLLLIFQSTTILCGAPCTCHMSKFLLHFNGDSTVCKNR